MIQETFSDVGFKLTKGAKGLGSNITEGAKGLVKTIDKGIQIFIEVTSFIIYFFVLLLG